MEGVLSQRLTQYFECLLGDQTTNKSIKTDINTRDKGLSKDTSENGFEATESSTKVKKKKKQKRVTAENQKIKTKALNNESSVGKTADSIRKQNHKAKDIHEAKPKKVIFSGDRSMAENKGFTDDGFKIVSSIPEDDSDVSDAFESCSEEEDDPVLTPCPRQERDAPSSRKPKETEDGFKIVTEIPPDDSDVSDAFEDDEDNFVSVSLPDRQRHIKKPLIQIMNDFGIDDKNLSERREETPKQPLKLSKKQRKLKKRQANTLTQAAKRRKQKEVLIIDCAKKRGANKERKSVEEELEPSPVESKPETLDEKQLKRVRYDVFKLGMSGFHKEKKEDARVALAIKLGAKPPRNKTMNYKKLQVIKKDEKKKEAEEKEMKLKLGLKVPKPFKKKEKPVVKAAASQIGRYRHGVQVVSKRDISKISKS